MKHLGERASLDIGRFGEVGDKPATVLGYGIFVVVGDGRYIYIYIYLLFVMCGWYMFEAP